MRNEPRSRSIVTGGPGVANKCLALLSKMFNMAEVWGLRPDGTNQCRHVKKYPRKAHERFLSEEELARLAGVLAETEAGEIESQFVIAAIRLLVFTGCRLGEIRDLRWENVKVDSAMLLLADSKTGRKPVYLNAPALDVLTNLPRLEGNPYVICGNMEGASLVNMQKPWGRIRKKAGLTDVRIHDLRHSFASIAAEGGASLPIIGALLGHRQSATTARYAHLAADPLKSANKAVGKRIAAAMKGGTEGAEVVSLSQRKL
jgi:integrase